MGAEPLRDRQATIEMVRQLAAASDLQLSEARLRALVPEVQGLLDRVHALYRMDVRQAQPASPFGDETWG
jgi:Asp-tRNA(Asn)/Glu-tRNA(Gln) amidotransferase C subunit